jgi:hypothetical protein
MPPTILFKTLKDIIMTPLTSVKSSAKKIILVTGLACYSLTLASIANAQSFQVKTEPLEQRDIEKPHLDVLLNVKKTVSKLSDALKTYTLNMQGEQAEFEACQDHLCRMTRLSKSSNANEVFASATMEHAENMRDIETNQIQYIIDTMQLKGDGYFESFTQKRADFFDKYEQVLPEIQALNIQSHEDYEQLTSDQKLGLEKLGVELNSNFFDLLVMHKEFEVIDKTKAIYEKSREGFHDHANNYELRSVKLTAKAFKQSRLNDFFALDGNKSISLDDLNSVTSMLSGLPESSDISFIPNIDCCSTADKEVTTIQTKISGGGWLLDGTLDRIEDIRNITRN